MPEIRIGTAGWSYKDWVGPFYPKTTKPSDYLAYYTKYFDIVEVNSTFYSPLPFQTLKNWFYNTPDDFRFSIKIWQKISHKRKNVDFPEVISEFFHRLRVLEPKIDYYLLQLPPWLKYSEKQMNFIQNNLDLITNSTEKKIAIEFRDNSWFDENIINEIVSNKVILCTAYLQDLKPFYYKNQSSIYIRAIGDRNLTSFNKTQRSMNIMSDHLLQSVKQYMNMDNISDIFIIYNNHFTGFSPMDSINLKKKLGLKYKDFNRQKSLMDFF